MVWDRSGPFLVVQDKSVESFLASVKVMPSSLLQSDGGAFTHMMVSTFTIGSREL